MSSTPTDQAPSSSAEPTLRFAMNGFSDVEAANSMAHTVGMLIGHLQQSIDLSGLDAITISYDYNDSLRNLDRGFAKTITLEPTNDDAIGVGVAMTPAVKRDGHIKCHMLFNAHFLEPLLDEHHPDFLQAVYIVAHECAHVQTTYELTQALPGVLLERRFMSQHQHLRTSVILSCWDEFNATRLSSYYGREQTEDFQQTLFALLDITRQRANEFIIAYRTHADHGAVFDQVYSTYATLMKHASYFLGNLTGLELRWEDNPRAAAVLQDHWFRPFLDKLSQAFTQLLEHYGKWPDFDSFAVIADITDELVAFGGLKIINGADGDRIEVPFTPETI